MNATSPHEISQAKCLNFNGYIVTEHNPWQRNHILMLDMCSLFESLKLALNFSRNVSKSLNKGDWCSNNGATKQGPCLTIKC
jgi:hypothetical protein